MVEMKIFSVEVDAETRGSIHQVARVSDTLILRKAATVFRCVYNLCLWLFVLFSFSFHCVSAATV